MVESQLRHFVQRKPPGIGSVVAAFHFLHAHQGIIGNGDDAFARIALGGGEGRRGGARPGDVGGVEVWDSAARRNVRGGHADDERGSGALSVGSNSASLWWLNGEETLLLSGDRRMVADDGMSKRITLKKGVNVLR